MSWIVLCSVLLATACASSDVAPLPADGLLPLGNWGGENAGLIVSDTASHLHVGCTFGDISGRVRLDATGGFSADGSFMLHAYPVSIGPSVPAHFAGRLVGTTITVTATVNDTVAHQIVVKGPVIVSLDAEMKLGPCPICRRPIITRTPRRT